MTDIGTIEKRTVYRIPEGEGFHTPYVGSEPWPEGTVTVDGDMMPVEQQAIPWCTTHDSPAHMYRAYSLPPTKSTHCHIAHKLGKPHRGTDCDWSLGGPEHKWWVDV